MKKNLCSKSSSKIFWEFTIIYFAFNYYVCWRWFLLLIFVVLGEHENFFATKISRFTAVCNSVTWRGQKLLEKIVQGRCWRVRIMLKVHSPDKPDMDDSEECGEEDVDRVPLQTLQELGTFGSWTYISLSALLGLLALQRNLNIWKTCCATPICVVFCLR